MTKLADPLQIPLRLQRAKQAIDVSLVLSQPSLLAAVKLCIASAGFERDKQVYGELDIDAGHWSRITRGEAHFPLEKLSALMDLCGNEAPLIWLVNSRGYDPGSLRKLESDLERQLRERELQIERLERDKQVLTEALTGRAAA